MDSIDTTALRQHMVQKRDSMWDDLDICRRDCPFELSGCYIYARWFAKASRQACPLTAGCPVSAACMMGLL